MRNFFSRVRVTEIDARDALQRQVDSGAVIVDVREDHEWRAGHIPGARHMPLGSLRTRAAELLGEREVIFVCRSGSRSASATAALTKAGHPNVANLAGGMIAWAGQGLPVTR